MCGRYSIAVERETIEKRFGATFMGDYAPRYNVAPSQLVPAILNADPGKIVCSAWGLKPAWMAARGRRDGLINVRLETLREKHTFKKELAKQRCLIPADGFYEWQTLPDGRKAPFRIVRRDGKLFAFAGIWDTDKDKEGLARFAIVTQAADEFMQPIHNRMPVILDASEEQPWLSPRTTKADLIGLLESVPSHPLNAYEVSRAVNNARHDSPDVITPMKNKGGADHPLGQRAGAHPKMDHSCQCASAEVSSDYRQRTLFSARGPTREPKRQSPSLNSCRHNIGHRFEGSEYSEGRETGILSKKAHPKNVLEDSAMAKDQPQTNFTFPPWEEVHDLAIKIIRKHLDNRFRPKNRVDQMTFERLVLGQSFIYYQSLLMQWATFCHRGPSHATTLNFPRGCRVSFLFCASC